MQRVKKMRIPKIWSPGCEGVLQPLHRGQKGRKRGGQLRPAGQCTGNDRGFSFANATKPEVSPI